MSEKAGTLFFDTGIDGGGLQKGLGALDIAVGNIMADMVQTVAQGFSQMVQAAIDEGAALEQSIGGVETLFKESADAVISYADAAYTSAGMSANTYMETVTGFAASLLQGLGGDTAKAAEIGNMAVVDMADNANKMGTAIENIQNAYQGFAKQNYTLLDNLKLGYGGTKTEMERLLKDAKKLTGIKYDINNLADVYSAIHVIQEELGITGTTAAEASATIAGSAAAMQAAFSNVLANLTLGEDVSASLAALADATATYLFDNLLPALQNIGQALPGALATFGEAMWAAGGSLVTNTVTGIIDNLPSLLAQALPMLLEFSSNIRTNAGLLVDEGINLILSLSQGLVASLPDLLAYVPQIVINIAGVINDNFPKILKAGVDLIATLLKGIWDNRGNIIDAFPKIIEAIFAVFQAVNWGTIGRNLVTLIGNGIKALASAPVNLVRTIAQAIVDTFRNGFSWSSLGHNIISGIASGISGAIGGLVNAAVEAARAAFNAAKSWLGIRSPSRRARKEIGPFIPGGIALGIEDGTDQAVTAAEESAVAAVEAARNAVEAEQASYGAGGDIGAANARSAYTSNFSGTVEVVCEMDGREVARGTAPFMDEQLDF